MNNNGLFSSLFIESLKVGVELDDTARGRMATLAQTWRTRDSKDTATLWTSFMKQAVSYLEFVPPADASANGVYPLYEDWGFSECIAVLYLIEPNADIDDTSVGRFYPAKLLAQLRKRKLNWGILTDGATWRLYSTKSSRPYEDYVELPLEKALESDDEAEYGLFERFFHKDSFVPQNDDDDDGAQQAESAGVYKCRLDQDKAQSEQVLEQRVKSPLLYQVDEVLQYLCNGFIQDTPKSGEEYTEEERTEIFESSVKLLYRCLFLFYAEAHHLLPSDAAKAEVYKKHSIQALCNEARRFRWGARTDTDQYDLWKHLKGLVNAVNDGDPEYGIMGYNGGLFDDTEERFLGQHQLRNDFLSRALYLLVYVEPFDNDADNEYSIPYQDLEVRHLGELYENILEYTVQLADADRIRRRTKKGVELLLASQTKKQSGDTLIRKGEVFFGESALERKQTGSYYTPESLVRFLNEKTLIQPLRERFEQAYRARFDEFLDEAINGPDIGDRRGAAQSAAALVERFAEEDLLQFKVCDPAMGSGHFLVDAANQMAGLVVELLEEIPDVDDLKVSVTSHPNAWRRRVTRHCLYGVDLNPLAVNLAKLSLWLNCFAKEHKLTFIDHHLRQGNSLIGLRSLEQLKSIPKRKRDGKRKAEQALLFDFDDLSEALTDAAKGVASITEIAEDDTDTQKAVLDESYEATSERLKPLADLFTAYLMDGDVTSEDYGEIFSCLANGKPVESGFSSDLPEVWERLRAYQERHDFFHWPLEFPDVFGADAVCGFSGTIGNPPWDLCSANHQEFFSVYDGEFRSLNRKQSLNRLNEICESNREIAKKWLRYKQGVDEQNAYFAEPSAYTHAPSGRNNLYQYFLLRGFDLLSLGGKIGVVSPSGLYTDKGCQRLRECFFTQSSIDYLYCFENRRAIFNIHRSFKFVLFGTTKGGTTDSFRCAFMEHDPERLPIIDADSLEMSMNQVRKFSPETLSVMEFSDADQLKVATALYKKSELLGDLRLAGQTIEFQLELMMNTAAKLFNEAENLQDKEGYLPLYEGKMIWHYDAHWGDPNYYVNEVRASEYTGYPKPFFRLGFRDVTASTNERTLVAAIIPPTFHGNTIPTIVPKVEGGCSIKETWRDTFYLLSVLNSFCCDFIARQKITNHMNFHYMKSLPIPKPENSELISNVVLNAMRLVCDSSDYKNLWEVAFDKSYINRSFYKDTLYGPEHEQQIRDRLINSLNRLTEKWEDELSVKDRQSGRRDAGDRAQLRAENDACIAHLYGLVRDEFAYVLDTFPVLKKKEEKAFGEFMSKRKCLEEYDRLAAILGEKS